MIPTTSTAMTPTDGSKPRLSPVQVHKGTPSQSPIDLALAAFRTTLANSHHFAGQRFSSALVSRNMILASADRPAASVGSDH
jgi:hypothetical protein